MKSRVILLLLFLTLTITLVSCAHLEKTNETDILQVIEPELTRKTEIFEIQVEPNYDAVILEPIIVGTERAIVRGRITPLFEERVIDDVQLLLVSDVKVKPSYIYIEDREIFAVFDGLRPETDYSLTIAIEDTDGSEVLKDQLLISTPVWLFSMEDIDIQIDELFSEQNIAKDNKLLAETQAVMQLLGLDTDPIGTFGFLTQANIVRLEYSFNSYEAFKDISNIFGEPTEELLNILKSLLAVSVAQAGESVIRNFVPESHSMTEYSKLVLCEKNYESFCSVCVDVCGKIDVDQYIYDLTKENYEAYQTYSDLPFIIETEEFDNRYRDKNLTKKQAEIEAAKNKAIFSLHQSNWLKTIAVQEGRVISIAGSLDDSLSVNTLIALSYMTMDAYYETGQVFIVRSGLRSYDEQEKIHYQVTRKSDINYWRDINWYKQRQKVSAVPGFSNHQYGIAVDFEGKFKNGISSFTKYQPELYTFLLKKGSSYGFYRNSSEPWHWAFLGKTFN